MNKKSVLYVVPDQEALQELYEEAKAIHSVHSKVLSYLKFEDEYFIYEARILPDFKTAIQTICGIQVAFVKFHERCLLDGRTLNYIMSRVRG